MMEQYKHFSIELCLNAVLFLSFHRMVIPCHGFLVSSVSQTPTGIPYPTSVAQPKAYYAKPPKYRGEIDEGVKIFDVREVHMDGKFTGSDFAATGCWATSPLVMRGAFRSQSDIFSGHEHSCDESSVNSLWPTWDEVMELALDEDAESRLITNVPGDPSSWRLALGPFEGTELENLISTEGSSTDHGKYSLVEKDEKWTIILNDVDRFHPPLYEFITDNFSFIPQWRKDDGQSKIYERQGC